MKRLIHPATIQLFKNQLMRCTNYMLSQFNVNVSYPVRYGLACIEHLDNAGCKLEIMENYPKTIRTFVRAYPQGKYYLSTAGHALALIDGQLFDYSERGIDLRRILVAVKISN